MIVKVKNQDNTIVEKEIGELAAVAFSGHMRDVKGYGAYMDVIGNTSIDSTKVLSLQRITSIGPVVFTVYAENTKLKIMDTVYFYNQTGAEVTFKGANGALVRVAGGDTKISEKYAMAALTYVGVNEWVLYGRTS